MGASEDEARANTDENYDVGTPYTTDPDGAAFQVKIIKPHPDSKLGILLVTREEGQPPEVESLKVGGLGHNSNLLRPGDVILSVNGNKVYDDETASQMIRVAVSVRQ